MSATTPKRNWQVALVLPQAGGVLETLPHRLVRDLWKLKGPGAFMLPARAISTKNKHLLVIYSIPTRGFTAAVSVFWGTPPPKPLDCKV